MIAERVVKEVNARMSFLLDVGLDYLSLSRSAGTLAGGEAQRIRLASQIGSGLVGVLYVLDEPSIGLAPARQPPADRHARATPRPRQHRARRRARRGDDPGRRPCRRHRAGCGRARRRGRVLGHGEGPPPHEGLDHRSVPRRQAIDPGAGEASRCPATTGSSSAARRSTTSATSTSRSRSAASSRSPACRARASPRSSARSC